MKDFVILPTYNERENIPIILEKLTSLYPNIYVLVVDDKSPDGTADVVRELQKNNNRLHLETRTGKLGLGSAYIHAIKKILISYPDVRSIITMDADLSHDPRVIHKMHNALDHYDLIIGSRYTRGGKLANWPIKRKMLSRCGNLYATLIVGIPVKDLTAGFQCFHGRLLRKYNFDAINASGFAFLMEMKIAAHRMNAKILEIPITFTDRVRGESKISKNIIYEGLIMPWKFRTVWRNKNYSKE